MDCSYRSSLAIALTLMLSAGCAPQGHSPIGNPIADGMESQARELDRLARICRKDAVAYREHPQAATDEACGGGMVPVKLQASSDASRESDRCAAGMIEELPSCQRWDNAYQAMITGNVGDTVRAHAEIEAMEAEELMRSR